LLKKLLKIKYVKEIAGKDEKLLKIEQRNTMGQNDRLWMWPKDNTELCFVVLGPIIYTSQDFCVATCGTTASGTVTIDPNSVGLCLMYHTVRHKNRVFCKYPFRYICS
jgi:hypothetical protein